jgi:hypothetical protein
MSDISQGPQSKATQGRDLASPAASVDLAAATLNTGLSGFDSVERTPHTRESVAARWRLNREFPDTGTRMIINAGGKV